ncbi:hypothetical protein KBD81_04245 [Candidatus Woesebacteria bacterium]|nr:hypothetical protein [Candidatus Woesebacteria bacterium]
MSSKRYASIFLTLLLMWSVPVHAQMNLELLENSPTPTPLPPGQEYILEIKPIQETGEVMKSSLSSEDMRIFDTKGVVVRSGEGTTSLQIEKTQLHFDTFGTSSKQDESTQLKLSAEKASGYELVMEVVSPLSSAHVGEISGTSCNAERRCTETRDAPWTETGTSAWGYMISGAQYRTPPLEPRTVFQSLASAPMTKKLTVRIVTDQVPDGIYSSTLHLILLPH